MRIEWKDSLSVGIAEIDEQHKLLFGKYNALLAAWMEGKGADEVYLLFRFLDAYIITHFAEEEGLMQRLGYPEAKHHGDAHLAFTRKVASFKERLKKEGPTSALVTSVSMSMTEWLVKHISAMDRALGHFMLAR